MDDHSASVLASRDANGDQPAITRILLADRSDMIRAGMRAMLNTLDDVEVVGEASDSRTAARLALKLMPDIVMMDIGLHQPNGLEGIRELLRTQPRLKVIVCAPERDQQKIVQVFRIGGSGYLLTDSSAGEVASALRAVQRGEMYLSPKAAEVLAKGYIRTSLVKDEQPGQLSMREREVLQLLVEGKTNREMSDVLGISVKTVEAHRAKLMGKLEIYTVAELTKYAIREGLTTVEN
jgi:DNA-binding NarL/FixJ family response regulator